MKREHKRGQNRQHYVELTTRNEGKDYTEKMEGFKVTHKGGLKTRKAIDIDNCSARSNKTNKIIRTQTSINNKINSISKKVELSNMTNKQRRRYYALNK
jgi:hypothetical protein